MTLPQLSRSAATWISCSLTILALPVLSLSGAELNLAKELDLVKNGQPRATIVLAQRPTASAQLAASELQYYLQKISAATLPIVRAGGPIEGNRILVGASAATRALGVPAAPLAPQEYLIQTAPGVLVLLGHDGPEFSQVDYQSYGSLYKAASQPIGTCYAAHAFLENQLGVKWYLPNETLGEVVPQTLDISVSALSIRRRPDIPVRSIYPLFVNTEKLTFSQWDQRQKFQAAWVNARTSLLYWIRNRMWGGQQHNANHSFNYFDKAFGNSHPEWFSTKSFARMQQLNYQMEVQPCLTAKGFREQVVAIARDYFAGRPEPFPGAYRGAEGRFFSVMPNDNTNMCGCPDCRPRYRPGIGPGGNASHYVWQFVNEVAREVRQTHPQAMISNCAYFNYTVPPEGLIFEPNVAVEFCKFYTYYADPNRQRRDHLRIAEFVEQNQVRFFTTWEYLLKPEMTDWAFPCLVPHVHVTDVRGLQKIGGFPGWQTPVPLPANLQRDASGRCGSGQSGTGFHEPLLADEALRRHDARYRCRPRRILPVVFRAGGPGHEGLLHGDRKSLATSGWWARLPVVVEPPGNACVSQRSATRAGAGT